MISQYVQEQSSGSCCLTAESCKSCANMIAIDQAKDKPLVDGNQSGLARKLPSQAPLVKPEPVYILRYFLFFTPTHQNPRASLQASPEGNSCYTDSSPWGFDSGRAVLPHQTFHCCHLVVQLQLLLSFESWLLSTPSFSAQTCP